MTDENEEPTEPQRMHDVAIQTMRRIQDEITEAEGQNIFDQIGDETNEIAYLLGLIANGGNDLMFGIHLLTNEDLKEKMTHVLVTFAAYAVHKSRDTSDIDSIWGTLSLDPDEKLPPHNDDEGDEE